MKILSAAPQHQAKRLILMMDGRANGHHRPDNEKRADFLAPFRVAVMRPVRGLILSAAGGEEREAEDKGGGKDVVAHGQAFRLGLIIRLPADIGRMEMEPVRRKIHWPTCK
jgi:hypothetical protein